MASLSHAAFFCIGGYVSAIVTLQLSAHFLIGVVLAVAITMIVGGVLAAPFIRVKEEYVLLFTLSFQMVIYHLMMSMDGITGGDSGIFGVPLPEILGWSPGVAGPVSSLYGRCSRSGLLDRFQGDALAPSGRVLKGVP